MDFLISSAHAADPIGGDGGLIGLAFPLILLGVFYFLMIRPQQKRAKEHQGMVAGLKKGDEIISGGGLGGTVTAVGDVFITVKVANNVEVRIQKASVASLLPKGTLKDA